MNDYQSNSEEHCFNEEQGEHQGACTDHLEPMIEQIHEIGYVAFQEVIALGRWPDGRALVQEDKPLALQAMLVYEHRHLPLEARTGFIHKGSCSSGSN